MVGLLLPVILTTAIGALWAGSLAGLRQLRIQWWPLALGAIAVQLVIHNPPVNHQPWALSWGPGIWVATLAMELAVLVRNALAVDQARNAWRLAALGVGFNLIVILANGGFMPQSAEARLAVRGSAISSDPGQTQLLYNVAPIDGQTRLAWLGDIIAQPTWLPKANVVSIGDLVLSTALAWWAFSALARAKKTQVRRRTADTQ